MKLVSFREGARLRAGRIGAAGEILPFAGCDMQQLIEARAGGADWPATEPPLAAAVQLLAPLPRPRRNVFCVGLNYRSHAAELAARGFNGARSADDLIPPAPVVFSKVPESVVGPGAAIEIPAVSSAVDYEAELAVVIGRGGRNIAAADALALVLGDSIVNDVTAGDLQTRPQLGLRGRGGDTVCPMGPCIVTADALDGANARIRLWVNGELRQDGNSNDLVFGIPAIIESISAALTLQPGDVIATGTPAGVAMGFSPPPWLKAGDVVKVEIDGIGVLENPVTR
ncbi:MAG: fumarylacetoacetate hydrolase family protein [Betaproteobacteria bacterium]